MSENQLENEVIEVEATEETEGLNEVSKIQSILKEMDPEKVFVEGGARSIVDKIKEVTTFDNIDIEKKEHQDLLRSNAYAIRKAKKFIDNARKMLKEKYMKKIRPIDAEGRYALEELDAHAEKVRQPLTDLENRIAEAEKAAREEAERIEREEAARLKKIEDDRRAEEQRQLLEAQKKVEEENARIAAENEKIEAEKRRQQEEIEAFKREKEAFEAQKLEAEKRIIEGKFASLKSLVFSYAKEIRDHYEIQEGFIDNEYLERLCEDLDNLNYNEKELNSDCKSNIQSYILIELEKQSDALLLLAKQLQEKQENERIAEEQRQLEEAKRIAEEEERKRKEKEEKERVFESLRLDSIDSFLVAMTCDKDTAIEAIDRIIRGEIKNIYFKN